MAYHTKEQVASKKATTNSSGTVWRTLAHYKSQIQQPFEMFHAPFSERRLLLLLMDALLLFIALYAAYWLEEAVAQIQIDTPQQWYWHLFMLIAWWTFAALNDQYDIRLSYDKFSNTIRVLTTGVLVSIFWLCLSFFYPEAIDLTFSLVFLAIALPLIVLWRLGYASLSAILPFRHRILILGQGQRGESIAKLLRQTSHLNYQVLGYVDEGQKPVSPDQIHLDFPVLGSTIDLPQLIRVKRVHEIVVAIEQGLTDDLFQLLVTCQSHGVRVSWMPDLFEKVSRCIPIEHIDPTWALCAVQEKPIFNRLQLIGKRGLDLAIVLLSLPAFIVLIPLLVLAIRLDTPGPAFYRQIRSGRGGRPFLIFKFRTMVTDAEKDGQPRWATKNDQRITRVGRLLRKTRLDELPQILNILRGEMSLVGPRPERPEFIKDLKDAIPFYQTRLMVKPGLTGWAQVNYDYGNSVEDALRKLQFDFYYIRYWSLWLDVYTIFKTIAVVFKFKGT